jgi:general secretion pathway protein L
VVVTGGGGRLVGLPEHLGEELHLPSEAFSWPDRPELPPLSVISEMGPDLPVAVGIAIAASSDAPQVSFRRGEFAYRSDFSFVRAKGRHIAVAMLAVVAFGAVNTWASLRGLRKEHDILEAKLKKASVEVFGQERMDPRAISDELKNGPKGLGQLPIPSTTAFDLLADISRGVPPSGKIKLDVQELDVKPKKMALRGTAETAQQVDDLAEALGKIECIEEVQKGKLVNQTVNMPVQPSPGSTPNDSDQPMMRPTEMKQFTLTIKTSCP